eukprot:TRINITY_DN7401_c0_g1_i1.p1 TRINITY_DN7401_c0_g1~~TRINITY_DN7401_c0_g1_i1.p1  ORF type:complete len:435 (+),score=54.20 TRINITY_DN7401_c0_g1_i1:180-1484(+)
MISNARIVFFVPMRFVSQCVFYDLDVYTYFDIIAAKDEVDFPRKRLYGSSPCFQVAQSSLEDFHHTDGQTELRPSRWDFRHIGSADQDDVQMYGRKTGPSGARIVAKAAYAEDHRCVQHQKVLLETLEALKTPALRARYLDVALQNRERWRRKRLVPSKLTVVMHNGDWGDVTLKLTQQYGTVFAVLNAASAYCPGGGVGYMEGGHGQEEDMFRRTDCHFSIKRSDCDMLWLPDLHISSSVVKTEMGDWSYKRQMQELLIASNGVVYLDTKTPRVCIRGPPAADGTHLGYEFLPSDKTFPFYELRAAPQDLRECVPVGSTAWRAHFDPEAARHRIRAQLETLRRRGIRHAVLGPFGCGEHRQPAFQVAELYKEALREFCAHFDVVAFAVPSPLPERAWASSSGDASPWLDSWPAFATVFQREDGHAEEDFDVIW